MQKALPVFQEVGLKVEPLFTEDLLALDEKIEEVYQYYTKEYPKTYPTGEQWNPEKILEILLAGRSIGELLEDL